MNQHADLASCKCPISNCQYSAMSIMLLLSHLRTIHSNDPSFFVRCGIDCCSYSAKAFTALYSHIYRRHPSYITRRSKTSVQHPIREGVFDSCMQLAELEGGMQADTTSSQPTNEDSSYGLEGKLS